MSASTPFRVSVHNSLWAARFNITEEEKQNAYANLGLHNIVMLDLSELFDDLEGNEGVLPNTSYIWDVIVNTILDGNIPAFQFNFLEGITGALALCTTTFEITEGMTRQEFITWLKQNSSINKLRFTLTADVYGGLMRFNLAFYITPDFGFVPYYTYTSGTIVPLTVSEAEADDKIILTSDNFIVFRFVNPSDYSEGFVGAPCGDADAFNEVLAEGIPIHYAGDSLDGSLSMSNMHVTYPSRDLGLNASNKIVFESYGFATVEEAGSDYGSKIPVIYSAGYRFGSSIVYNGITGWYYKSKDIINRITNTETTTGS